MIQIAWQLPNISEWSGGLNYYVNLASALFSLPDRKIEPILLAPERELPAPLDRCRTLPAPQKPPKWHPRRILTSALRSCCDNGGTLAYHLKKNNIKLLSHGQVLGRNSPVPALCWIPDFQHVHLPEFFTPEECRHRDTNYRKIATRAQAIVLSSEAVREDFARLFPEESHKVHVLRFVAGMFTQDMPPVANVLKKYAICEPYFHVPNQLWAHKNHNVIIDALYILHQRGQCPLVISTGLPHDYRNPPYFSGLMQKIARLRLETRLRFLGLTPFSEVGALMRGAVAMLNPSLFEGWSTTVEEAKSLGKRIILSDIAVHREQNPDRSIFFDPYEPEELAEAMENVIHEYDSNIDNKYMLLAKKNLPKRIQTYGSQYQNIVLDII